MPGVVSHRLCVAWILQPRETRTHISLFHLALKIVFQQFPSTCQDSDPKGCERIHHYFSSTKMHQTPIKCQAPRWALGTQGESAGGTFSGEIEGKRHQDMDHMMSEGQSGGCLQLGRVLGKNREKAQV